MAQKVDLYSILTSYVAKHNNPYIEPDLFITFLENYAKRNAQDRPEWNIWKDDTRGKFYSELAGLAEEGKCELLNDTREGRIYIPQYYLDLLREYYRVIDDNADTPFPSEESMRITIPERQVRSLGVGSELASILDESPDTIPPIIRIGFPEDFGTALVLSDYVPQRLMEACLLKVRNYLRDYGNKEYAHSKLTSQLMGKESALKDILNRIILRPLDCYGAIAEGGEFSYLFWAHFCVLVKNDVKKKKDCMSNDIAAIQAVYIIEAMNGYFKNRAAKEKEKELAFKSLEQILLRPPYLYTLDQIIKFTNSKGILLLGIYSREELAEKLKKLTSESREGKLPELLVLAGPNIERYFIMKNKILLLCSRLVIEARDKVKHEISKKWLGLIKNYQTEPAMENDREFEKALSNYTEKLCPVLGSILEDPKFQLVYEELDQVQEIPPSSKIFSRGSPMTYSSLYLLRRRDLLEDTRLFLPFWYSMPFLISVIAFFKNLFGKKEKYIFADAGNDPEEIIVDEVITTREGNRDILNAVRQIEYDMVPKDHNIDTYLEELKVRWSRLINKQAREDLVEDVNSLVRYNLRQTLRVQKHYKITRDNIIQLAGYIMENTPTLQRLHGKDSLRTYIELYLVKLLGTVRY